MMVNITYATTSQTANSSVLISREEGLQLDALLTHVILSVLGVVTLYLLVALIVHHRRSASTCTVISVLHTSTALFALFGMFLEQVALRLETKGDIFCQSFTIVFNACYFLGILSTFTLFWFRQKSLYSTPLLRAYNGKCWRCVSTFIIVGIYAVMLPIAAVMLLTFKFQSTKNGCELRSAVEDGIIVLLVLITSTVVFQIALLLLMIYPLKNVDTGPNSASKSTRKLIRRLIVCTAVIIASELVGGTIAAICLFIIPNSFWYLVAYLDVLANLIAVTCSFVNWKERLFPFGKIGNRS